MTRHSICQVPRLNVVWAKCLRQPQSLVHLDQNEKLFLQAEDGIRDLVRSRGLGDVYKRQHAVRHPYIDTKGMTEADLDNLRRRVHDAIEGPLKLSLIHI